MAHPGRSRTVAGSDHLPAAQTVFFRHCRGRPHSAPHLYGNRISVPGPRTKRQSPRNDHPRPVRGHPERRPREGRAGAGANARAGPRVGPEPVPERRQGLGSG